jgi:acyl-coenzyme A synthetase/AMP-(fatty) acid ligase
LIPRRTHRDELVAALPVAHIYGFTLVIGAACAGMPVYFLQKFNPVKVLDAIETRRTSIFAGVPAMYRMLMEAGAEARDLSCVRMWISGADAMPQELSQQFKKLGASVRLPVVGSVGEATFAEGYGMVETGRWRGHADLAAVGVGRARRLHGPAAAGQQVQGGRPRRQRGAGGLGGRAAALGPVASSRATTAPPRRRPPPSPPTAGCAPATWPAAVRSAR